jgi:hypothetical protein
MSTTTLVADPVLDISTLSDQEKKELVAETVSVASDTTTAILGNPELSFTPIKSFIINAKGIPVLRLPLYHSELETTITNTDGSLAYVSTRAKKSSGNCILRDATGKALLSTTYFFGPSKDPVVTKLDTTEDIKTVSKWTSRDHSFVLPDGRILSWSYKKENGFGAKGAKGTALVLKLGEKRIATLVRNDETRTPGSKSCSAGNGGELVLGEGVDGNDGVSEDLVVATCLLMLKKEIDRRRTVQFMMIAGAGAV